MRGDVPDTHCGEWKWIYISFYWKREEHMRGWITLRGHKLGKWQVCDPLAASPSSSCLLTWNHQESALQWWDSYKILDLKYFTMPQSTQPFSLLLSTPCHPGLRSEKGLVSMKRLLKYDFSLSSFYLKAVLFSHENSCDWQKLELKYFTVKQKLF